MTNGLIHMVSKFGSAIIGLLLTPYVVRRIGLVQFGLWALVTNLIAYIYIADPGIGYMVMRYSASSKATGELRLVPRVITFGMAIYFALGLALAPLAIWLLPFLSRSLQLPKQDLHLAGTVFILGYFYFFLLSGTSVLMAALAGVGDLWLTSYIDLSSRITYGVIVALVLLSHPTVLTVVFATYVQTLLAALATYLAYRLRHGPVFGNPLHLTRSHTKAMLRFGGWIQAGTICELATTETDPLVIGIAFSVADVGIYNFADTVASQIEFLPLAFLNAFLPEATDAFERGNTAALRRLAVDGSRLLALLSLGIAGLAASLSPLIFTAWLGRHYPHVDLFLGFLVTIYGVKNLSGVTRTLAAAIGRPDLVAKNLLFGAVANVLATVSLALLFGLPGVLAGTLIGVCARTVMFQRRFYRLMGLSLREGQLDWLIRLCLAVTVAATAIRLSILAIPTEWMNGRVGAIPLLAFLVLSYSVVLLASLRVTGFLRPSDALAFSNYVPGSIQMLLNSHLGRKVFGHTPFLPQPFHTK